MQPVKCHCFLVFALLRGMGFAVMPAACAFVLARRRRPSAKMAALWACFRAGNASRSGSMPLLFCCNHAPPAGALCLLVGGGRAAGARSREIKGEGKGVNGKGGGRKKGGASCCSFVLLRQNRQAKLASLKDDLLRYLLFGVDPIGNEKETQKFESQSVASSQGRLPCALVVLLRRETTPLYVHKRQIGGQISANEPNNETRQAASHHAAARGRSGSAAPSRREAALMLRTTRTAST